MVITQVYANNIVFALKVIMTTYYFHFSMQFFHLHKTNFFHFFCFLNKMTYRLNVVSAMKKMVIKELRDFIYKNFYSQIGRSKENSYCSTKF